ncbi:MULTISPECIES: response regulator transcription factor [Corallococcus]|uniref:LuxR family transcriptional regulator n=1 Tax=Corallococcus TaxID=83461 RepID=UPI001180CC84|nr:MULTISPECIES: response regulator transcription factor [Corallococcus]NBD10534.1 response regulator [Corallococcus silvisoli]TSC27734.1 response regulator transcription factor [Corallococcus sp. Z5C101001]
MELNAVGREIRVALLEDQQLFRESLVALLEGAGMKVVARCAETGAFLSNMRAAAADVAVVDLRLEHVGRAGAEDGMSALKYLHDFHPQVRALVLSGHQEPDVVERCFQVGAAGYLCKLTVGCDDVVRAVGRVARGERLLPVDLLHAQALHLDGGDMPPSVLTQLTFREREVLGYVAAGADNLKIAAHLGITERTVKAHLTSIYRKLGPENRAQLAVMACELGVPRPVMA